MQEASVQPIKSLKINYRPFLSEDFNFSEKDDFFEVVMLCILEI